MSEYAEYSKYAVEKVNLSTQQEEDILGSPYDESEDSDDISPAPPGPSTPGLPHARRPNKKEKRLSRKDSSGIYDLPDVSSKEGSRRSSTSGIQHDVKMSAKQRAFNAIAGIALLGLIAATVYLVVDTQTGKNRTFTFNTKTFHIICNDKLIRPD